MEAVGNLEPEIRPQHEDPGAVVGVVQRPEGLLEDVGPEEQAQGRVQADLPAMRAVGYRQAWEALDEGLDGDALLARVRERGIAATRQLAKRQLTWLRSMPHRQVVPCDADDALERCAALVAAQWGPGQ